MQSPMIVPAITQPYSMIRESGPQPSLVLCRAPFLHCCPSGLPCPLVMPCRASIFWVKTLLIPLTSFDNESCSKSAPADIDTSNMRAMLLSSDSSRVTFSGNSFSKAKCKHPYFLYDYKRNY